MNVIDLSSWLMSDGISDEFAILVRSTVRAELDNLEREEQESSVEIDWSRLLFAGSILARSDQRRHKEAALRIATGAVTLENSQAVKDTGAILLDKLINFRAVELADHRSLIESDLGSRLGMTSRMEMQRRRLEHSVIVKSSGEWLPVNSFQQDFWENVNEHAWLSASAPTASGKTFLVLHWLIDHMRSSETQIAVYLAPTRALVSEIESELAAQLGEDRQIEVSSLPLGDKYNQSLNGGAKIIYVFTQERLHLLVNALRDQVKIDLLVVDEAHKIGDNQRGIILQDATERLERSNPNIKLVFLSPATQNPEVLLADAPVGARSIAINCDFPTVLQNVIVAEQVPRRPTLWHLSVIHPDGQSPIGVLKLASKANSVKKKLGFIAAAIGARGGTLVYANTASDAEEIALLITQLLPVTSPVDEELQELADLARKGVHPEYFLAKFVELGVAFHYGNMPSLIRLEIERLFRSGKIKFLVCTSTLIEGVNLSCRTIVIRGPRRGLGNPMEPHDFWNLAGRAGRWGNEFQGNIVCVEPSDSGAWPSGVPPRSRYPIKRESDAVLEMGGLSDFLIRRASKSLPESEEIKKYENVGAYLLATFIRLGSISRASVANRHPPEMIAQLDLSLSTIAAKIEIRSDIVDRHPGVNAIGLQGLLESFRQYDGDVENLLPAPAESNDSYDRMVLIMRRINEHLFPAFLPDPLIPLHALIVLQWIRGNSLAEMIRRNIKYQRDHAREFVLGQIIRKTMDLVEQTARFLAPKYLSAYMDVLRLHLVRIGRQDLIDEDLDIGTQLEFGVSTLTLLSLMQSGLTRMSAVALYEKIARDDLSTSECVLWVKEHESVLETMGIPAVILKEIRLKLLAKDSSN